MKYATKGIAIRLTLEDTARLDAVFRRRFPELDGPKPWDRKFSRSTLLNVLMHEKLLAEVPTIEKGKVRA